MGGKTVDVRILEAVGFVLAGAACGSSSGPPARNVEVVQVAPSPSAATSPIATASAPPVAIAPPEKVDGTTPQALCEDYRRRVKVDPASVTKTTEGHGLLPAGEVQARPNGNGKITCVIRRVHEPATVTYTFQPRCCPPPHGPRPACPPQQRKAEGWRTLIENVVLAEDGTFLSTSAVWSTRPKDDENERQPYCGRRPEGFAAAPAATRDTGALLAEMSMLEAAAVAAFDRLARELEALGAPEAFVLRARRAREDEVRHARVTAELARRRGADPAAPLASALPCRDAFAVALENATEGCVFETYGALVATLQAERARDPALRRALVRIARDERRHAELAADLHRWFCALLPEACAALEAARTSAVRQLLADASRTPALASGDDALGSPSRHEAVALSRAFFGLSAA